jgi:transcriptional regulator with XRE-family HTH domain
MSRSGSRPGERVVISEQVLGERVRAARVESGLSQADLAQAIGADQPTVSRIEAGRDISSIVLSRIAQATGQDLDYFVRPNQVSEADVLLRAGGAHSAAVTRAVRELDRFVRDYEFLLELT